MIKLIVSDIDGTLLPYGKTELDAELFSLIRRLRERGVIFCPASGRQYHSLRALFAPVCDELTYLCENGAILYGPGPEDSAPVLGKTVMERSMALELIHDIAALPGGRPLISGANTTYVLAGDPEFEEYMRTNKGNNVGVLARPEDMPEDVIKLAAYCPEGTSPTRHALGPEWDGLLSMASAGPDLGGFHDCRQGPRSAHPLLRPRYSSGGHRRLRRQLERRAHALPRRARLHHGRLRPEPARAVPPAMRKRGIGAPKLPRNG